MKAVLHLLVRPRAWALVAALSAVALAGVSGSVGSDARAASGDATLIVFPGFDGAVEVRAGEDDATTCTLDPEADTQDGCRLSFPPDTTVDLKAIPPEGSTVHHWSIPGCTGETCEVKAPGAGEELSVIPFYDPAVLQVTVSGTGTVTSKDGQIADCGAVDGQAVGDCDGRYTPGTPVELTADSAEVDWAFGCEPDEADPKTCLALPEAVWVGVAFGGAPPPGRQFEVGVYLRVTKDGRGVVTGRVGGDGKIDCGGTCSARFDYGAPVTVAAKDDPPYEFDHWQGGACGKKRSCTFSVGPISTLRAVFVEAKPPKPDPPAKPEPPKPEPPAKPEPPKPEPPAKPDAPQPPTEPETTKPVPLTARIVRVAAGTRRPYRVRAWVQVSKDASARLLIGRGRALYGNRVAAFHEGLNVTALKLARRAKPGKAWLVIALRDADGQMRTLSRAVKLGR